MTDDQFQKLRTLILDQMVEIKALALALRSLERRIDQIEARSAGGPTLYSTEELVPVLKIRQSHGPRSDSE